MDTTKRRQLTDEERAERRRQDQQLTERAVAQLRCSEGWQRWLAVRARVGLRRYSVLIWRASVLAGKESGGLRRGLVINGGAPRRWSDPRSDWSALDLAARGRCPRTSRDLPRALGVAGGAAATDLLSALSRACVQAGEMLVAERKQGLTAELLDPLRRALVWLGRPPRLAEVRGLSPSEILLGRRYRRTRHAPAPLHFQCIPHRGPS
jgi:hypothetical protein